MCRFLPLLPSADGCGQIVKIDLLALPRAHALILHAPSPPYSPGLPRMTPRPCPPAPPTRNSTRFAAPRRQISARVVRTASYVLRISPAPRRPPRRPRCRPCQAWRTASSLPLSPYIYPPPMYQPPPPTWPPANLLPVLSPLAHPPTASSSSPADSPWSHRCAVYVRARLPRRPPRSRGSCDR